MSRRPSWWAEPVYRPVVALGIALFGALRLRFRVRGAEHLPAEGPAVVAITHFGYLDFALTEKVLWQQRGRLMRFLATAASFRHRISGPLMRGMRHIPVERGAGQAAFPEAIAALQRGEVVGIFPEAGVSESWTVRPLKSGAVRMAVAVDVPIIPVAVWGGHRLTTKGHGFSLRRSWKVPIHIEIGAPLHPNRSRDIAAQTAELREALNALVLRAIDGYPVPEAGAPHWWMPAALGGSAPVPADEAAGSVETPTRGQTR